jgi:RND family efflux transporter MFP subunit
MKQIFSSSRSAFTTLAFIFAALSILASCGKQKTVKTEGVQKTVHSMPITVSMALSQNVEITENSTGYVENKSAPTISAEVAGKVNKILVEVGDVVKAGDLLAVIDDTDIKLRETAIRSEYNRLRTLVANQERNIVRLRVLAKKKVTTENQIDDAESQLKAMHEQLSGAKAQLASARREMGKTKVYSPIAGGIENKMIFAGEFLSPGRAMFTIVSNDDKYLVHLPMPETVSKKIRQGQAVRLLSPVEQGRAYSGTVEDVRPSISMASKSIDVIVKMFNPGKWKSGSSITGVVVVDLHKDAVVVPSQCVVLRPAGEVVYVVDGTIVSQRVVKTGTRKNDMVEIVEGLKAGETVARDGAPYLSDGALIKIQEADQR